MGIPTEVLMPVSEWYTDDSGTDRRIKGSKRLNRTRGRLDADEVAIVEAVTYWEDPVKLAEISTGLGEAMAGIELDKIAPGDRMAPRGW